MAQAANIAALAHAFAAQLESDIGPENMAEVVRLNRDDSRYSVNGSCASHDFCDANMTMLAAWESTFGNQPAMLDPSATDEQENESIDLWGAAWALAFENGFFK